MSSKQTIRPRKAQTCTIEEKKLSSYDTYKGIDEKMKISNQVKYQMIDLENRKNDDASSSSSIDHESSKSSKGKKVEKVPEVKKVVTSYT